MCDRNAQTDAFWAGVFFESISNATCNAIGNRVLSEALLPRTWSYIVFKHLTVHAVTLEVLTALLYIALRIIGLAASYVWVLFVLAAAMQAVGGVLWMVFMQELGTIIGEQTPTWVLRSALIANVTTLIAVLVSHILLMCTMYDNNG